MTRTSLLLFVAVVCLYSCSREQPAAPATQAASAASSGAGEASYGAAAARLQDACSVMPADLVTKLVPNASAPVREPLPPRCTASNGKSVLQISFDTGPSDPVNGAEFISGLAGGGYLERLDPTSKGDVYLTVILGNDGNGTNHNMHVEVAGHDGKEHKEDAIAVARSILARLR